MTGITAYEPGMVVRLRTGAAPMIILRPSISGASAEVMRLPSKPMLRECLNTERRPRRQLQRLRRMTDVDEKYADRLDPDYLHEIDPDLSKLVEQHLTYDNEENDMTAPKLYQTKEETPRFGSKLATNSHGKLVLEMKGTGEVLTFDPSQVEVVHPYTVSVEFLDGAARTYSYLARKGDVEVGDLILIKNGSTIARVVDLDTKSPKATKHLVGRKLMTAPIGDDAAEVIEDDD